MTSENSYTYNLRNQRSIYGFIDKQFEQHAKLLPVRVDLGYKSNETVTNMVEYPLNYHLPHDYLTKEDILNNWEILLNKLRWNHRSLLKELVGYIWKIEYGEDKGIHYHLMLFFNGNRVQKDYYYADELGKLWLDITGGFGTYFNCSADKDNRYGDRNCLQVTHRNDDRNNLYNAASYLTKQDCNEDIARMLSSGRVFGRSSV